jgi:hypothetical protein
VKSYEEIMEILEAFDLTGSFRAAGELARCSHHTGEAYVARRDAGLLPSPSVPVLRVRLIDPFLPKLEEWVERSQGKIRGDVVFDKLEPLGFAGSGRTVRRALAQVKANYRAGRRRVYRPWITEPGMWAQWDWGHGPLVNGRQTHLWCAWLAWCRFRVVVPTWDKTLPTVIGCLDRAMRIFDADHWRRGVRRALERFLGEVESLDLGEWEELHTWTLGSLPPVRPLCGSRHVGGVLPAGGVHGRAGRFDEGTGGGPGG